MNIDRECINKFKLSKNHWYIAYINQYTQNDIVEYTYPSEKAVS